MEISDKDEHLISILRKNGRQSVSELARQLSVSRTAAQMRLQKLERNGVIEGYSVTLSSAYAKSRIRALVMIKFPPGRLKIIEATLLDIRQVTTVYSISGTFDLAIVVSSKSMGELDEIIDKIGCIEGIDDTMSSLIMSTKVER